jgi:hypothetical protein
MRNASYLRNRGSLPIASMPRPFNRLKRNVEGEEAVEERRLAVPPAGQEVICWIRLSLSVEQPEER